MTGDQTNRSDPNSDQPVSSGNYRVVNLGADRSKYIELLGQGDSNQARDPCNGREPAEPAASRPQHRCNRYEQQVLDAPQRVVDGAQRGGLGPGGDCLRRLQNVEGDENYCRQDADNLAGDPRIARDAQDASDGSRRRAAATIWVTSASGVANPDQLTQPSSSS